MATSENNDSNRRKTDGAGVRHHATGFDQFSNDIVRFELDTSLVDYLISRCVLTIDDADRIREESGKVNRNKLMFNILKDRPYDSFSHFTKALQKTRTIPDADLVNKIIAFEIKDLQPDVKFADKSIKIEDFQVRFQKSYQTLVEEMSIPMYVADELLELETLNMEDYEDIDSLPTTSKKNRKILSKVATKGKSGYESFLRIMKESDDSEEKRLADEIENMRVTTDDKLLLQIGWTYENVGLSSDVRELIKIELEEWQRCDKMFIPTRAANDVLTKIRNKSCITITGNSGMGKTMAVRHVALEMLSEGYIIVPLSHPDEIVTLYSAQKNTVFVIDDLCGKYTMNQNYLERLKLIFEKLELLLRNHNCKIISSCRLQVFKDVEFKTLSIFKECECNLNSDSFNLTQEEMETFAAKYFGEHKSEALSLSKEYDCFPFLCKLYHKQKSINFDTFRKNPFQFIGEEIDNLLLKGDEGKYKYCVLVLCVINSNQLTEKYLTGKIDKDKREIIEQVLEECELNKGTSPKCLSKALDTLVGTFLTKDKNCYRMLHDKLYDFVLYHLGQTMVDTIIEYGDIALIRERFVWDASKIEDKVDLTINLPDDAVDSYIERMIKDWTNKNIIDFFSNKNLKSPEFTNKVLDQLNKLDTSRREELVSIVDTSQSKDTPLIRSIYAGNLKLTQWICLQYGADINKSSKYGYSPLYTACEKGYVVIVRELIKHGADLDKCNGMLGRSPLIVACKEGHLEIVTELLQHGADIDKCEKHGQSPLYTACNAGYIKIVRELLQHKPDINKSSNNGWSPLNTACAKGDVKIVRELLQHNPDINKCNNNGWSPLNTACPHGYVEIVKELLLHKPDINKCNNNGWSPLHIACAKENLEIVRTLLQFKPDIDKSNNNGWSPLNTSCEKGNVEIVKRLLRHTPDINKCNNNGFSPLNTACLRGYVEIIRELLLHKPDINKSNKYGWSPLYIACAKGYKEVVRELLHHNPDINKCDYWIDWSLLHTACLHGDVVIVRELLLYEPDINKCDREGESPLHKACLEGYVEIVKELLQYQPDINKCNNDGWSLLYIASKKGYIEIVRELIQHEPEINKCDKYGDSPLYIASQWGNVDIVRELLQHEPDINKCNTDGESPLYTACRWGNTDIVKELL